MLVQSSKSEEGNETTVSLKSWSASKVSLSEHYNDDVDLLRFRRIKTSQKSFFSLSFFSFLQNKNERVSRAECDLWLEMLT